MTIGSTTTLQQHMKLKHSDIYPEEGNCQVFKKKKDEFNPFIIQMMIHQFIIDKKFNDSATLAMHNIKNEILISTVPKIKEEKILETYETLKNLACNTVKENSKKNKIFAFPLMRGRQEQIIVVFN